MISILSDATYYARAENWIVDAWDIVPGADQFYELLRATPQYVPRRIAREIWGAYREQTGWEPFITRRDPDKPLLRQFFLDVDSISDFAYNVRVKFTGTDKDTGLPSEDWKVIGFDHMPTQGEIGDMAMSDLGYSAPDTEPETVQWKPEFYYHRQDLEW